MIAVDTSALMAIVLDEPLADACAAALETDDSLLISAGTLAELRIVAGRRGLEHEMEALVDGLGFEIVSVTPAAARRIGQIYATWGKGLHPASLNFGDCFSYDVAAQNGCQLLFVGDDFARTDISSALDGMTARSRFRLNEP